MLSVGYRGFCLLGAGMLPYFAPKLEEGVVERGDADIPG